MTFYLTVAANALLLGVLIPRRHRFPVCFAAQMMVIAMSVLMGYAYFSPAVDQASYHAAWQMTDGLCILCAAGIGWEMPERCSDNFRCILGWSWIGYAAWCLYEYLPDEFLGPNPLREISNLILTALTAIAFMLML